MENTTRTKWLARIPKQLVLIPVVVLMVAILLAVLLPGGEGKQKKPEVLTVSTLEKIVQVSKLSTYTAVYNGIAQVMAEEEPEQIEYYVAYRAKVNAGIDFEKTIISIEEDTQTVRVKVPEVYLTDVDVDIASMEFIFRDSKANASTVTQEAYRACEADVREESAKQEAILEAAKQNAVNVITALVQPLLEQENAAYTLTVE